MSLNRNPDEKPLIGLLDALASITKGVLGSESVESRAKRCASLIREAIGVDAVVLRRLVGEELIILGADGIAKERLLHSLPSNLGLGARMIKEQQALAVPEVQLYAGRRASMIRGGYEFISYAGAPMIVGGEVVGVVGVYAEREPREFNESELALLQIVADHFGVVLKNESLFKELIYSNMELDTRVMSRTAELEAANKEMESFTYMVAHDLRGPVRAISSTSMILLQDHAEQLSPEAKYEVERQVLATRRLSDLIDDLLTLARLGRRKAVPERIDLSKMARNILATLETQTQLSIESKVDPDLVVLADPELLDLMLTNLFENAIKFRKPGTAPSIHFGMTNAETFFVADKGIGFDMKFANKVFEPFERLVSDRDYEGTGIGLANVRRIVQRHGGQIWVDSNPGEGTTFYFDLTTVP